MCCFSEAGASLLHFLCFIIHWVLLSSRACLDTLCTVNSCVQFTIATALFCVIDMLDWNVVTLLCLSAPINYQCVHIIIWQLESHCSNIRWVNITAVVVSVADLKPHIQDRSVPLEHTSCNAVKHYSLFYSNVTLCIQILHITCGGSFKTWILFFSFIRSVCVVSNEHTQCWLCSGILSEMVEDGNSGRIIVE